MGGNITKEKLGLNRRNIKLLTGLVFVILLLFGPVDPCGIVIRLAYLIFIPVLIFYFLKHFGGNIKLDKIQNDYLN